MNLLNSIKSLSDLFSGISTIIRVFNNKKKTVEKVALKNIERAKIIGGALGQAFPKLAGQKNYQDLNNVLGMVEKFLKGKKISGFDNLFNNGATKNSRVVITEDNKNPFQLTEEIINETEEIIAGKDSDEEKALAIYLWLEKNVAYGNTKRQKGYRASTQVFETSEGECGEMAILFIVMARLAGLKANYVHVDIDYKGEAVNHACAVVDINGRDILVDPAYHTFNIKHQKYDILPDPEMVEKFKRYQTI